MIVLDTNVVSELARGQGSDARVRVWLRGLAEQPVTTVINRAELLVGITLLPPGARRESIAADIGEVLSNLAVCLPLTLECSDSYAEIVAVRTAMGRPIGTMDALIAAIARVHGAGVATRDIAGFGGLGLRLVDPWA